MFKYKEYKTYIKYKNTKYQNTKYKNTRHATNTRIARNT